MRKSEKVIEGKKLDDFFFFLFFPFFPRLRSRDGGHISRAELSINCRKSYNRPDPSSLITAILPTYTDSLPHSPPHLLHCRLIHGPAQFCQCFLSLSVLYFFFSKLPLLPLPHSLRWGFIHRPMLLLYSLCQCFLFNSVSS